MENKWRPLLCKLFRVIRILIETPGKIKNIKLAGATTRSKTEQNITRRISIGARFLVEKFLQNFPVEQTENIHTQSSPHSESKMYAFLFSSATAVV